MASVLSLSPLAPYGHHNHDRAITRSLSSLRTCNSNGTVRHARPREPSITSVVSGLSQFPSFRYTLDQVSSVLSLPTVTSHDEGRESDSITASPFEPLPEWPTTDWSAMYPVIRNEDTPTGTTAYGDDESTAACNFSEVSAVAGESKDSDSIDDVWHDLPGSPIDAGSLPGHDEPAQESPQQDEFHPQAFRRWVSTLRRRHADAATPAKSLCLRRKLHSPRAGIISPDRDDTMSAHRRSGSQVSSMAFVTGLRSGSMTMTSTSLPSIISPTSMRSPRSTRQVCSPAGTDANVRSSIDSDRRSLIPALDEAATKRSQKRARKLQELVRTEEGYVADLKSLNHIFFTMMFPQLVHTPVGNAGAQSCLGEILQLHEQMLVDLQFCACQLIPAQSVKSKPSAPGRPPVYSYDFEKKASSIPTTSSSYTGQGSAKFANSNEDADSHLCTPELAADVARLFIGKIKRFCVYDEYGARCESLQATADAFLAASSEIDLDRALEVLQGSVSSDTARQRDMKKALGVKDLLIKPVQRMIRYELLLKDLCTLTPSYDDPVSHTVLEDALYVVSQTCHDLNDASSNPAKLRLLDSHRLLQRRLMFETSEHMNSMFHEFGRLLLCGVLYIAYRGTTSVKGQYIMCILYESCFLAAVVKSSAKYQVLLVAPLSGCALDTTDNGKALQCHTTPHAWKLTFENEGSLFEIVSVACSENESDAWQRQIAGRIAVEKQRVQDGYTAHIALRSPLTDEMRSVGKAYGQMINFGRHVSVQRAATLGPMPETNQVIIRNTQAAGKENQSTTSVLPIPRSQSVVTPGHIPVLAPRRSDRIRLEAMLMDVWTKDAVPFPGLGSRRGDYGMRASAGHVIRKLSMASITSNFSKRSMSYTSISQASSMDDASMRSRLRQPIGGKSTYSLAGRRVDFHSDPAAFLPEDFDIKQASKARGRLAGLRTLTMGAERSRTPFCEPSALNSADGIKRSRSVMTRRRSATDIPASPRGQYQTTCQHGRLAKVAASVDPTTRPTCAGTTVAQRLGVRQRARSTLNRLLG